MSDVARSNAIVTIGPSVTAAVIIAALFLAPSARTRAASQPSMTTLATGLTNPRGLKFGPDGYLYVAEGGTGGTDSLSACVIKSAFLSDPTRY